MGVRFRKRFKLLPGVYLNASKSGTSISLGGRGATLNVSSRGVRSTVGIPGTGLSFTSTSGTGRKVPSNTLSQAGSPTVAAANKSAIAEAERARIAASERAYELQLNSWRHPSASFQVDDVLARLEKSIADFPSTQLATRRNEEAALRGRIKAEARRRFGRHPAKEVLFGFLRLAGAAVSFFVSGIILIGALNAGPLLGLLGVGGATWLTFWGLGKAINGERAHQITEDIQMRLGRELPRLQEAFRSSDLRFENDVRALISGEVSIIETRIDDALGRLEVPYELTCAVEVLDAGNVYVDLDLPEIEDVVATVREKARASGEVSMLERPIGELNGDYSGLAIGLAYRIAAEIFATAPTVELVCVGAFTQRLEPRTGNVEPQYVYQVSIERAVLAGMNLARLDPKRALDNFQHVVKFAANGYMATIPGPSWLDRNGPA